MEPLSDWAFPGHLQPKPDELDFDLDAALNAMVMLRAEIPEDAFTASFLGTERVGNGVVIRDDGLVLTIGYLVTEASEIWLTTNSGVVVPAYTVSYDQATGFALVQPLARIGVRPLARGSSTACTVGDDMIHYGRAQRPPRAWLGIYAAEVEGHLAIGGVTAHGPAAEAGLKVGDVVVEVQGRKIKGLANLFREIWNVGPAGTTVELTVTRKGKLSHLSVRSADRSDLLKKPRVH